MGALEAYLLNREHLVPPIVQHVWDWFWELHRGRHKAPDYQFLKDGGWRMGVRWTGLQAGEMKAWAEMTGSTVRREEWHMLFEMDRAFLAAENAKLTGGGARASSSKSISVDAFDAVFG